MLDKQSKNKKLTASFYLWFLMQNKLTAYKCATRGDKWLKDTMKEINFSTLFIYFVLCKLIYTKLAWRTARVWLSFMDHLARKHRPSIYTVSYLLQLSVFSRSTKPFIASAFPHENPLALIKTCIDVWRPQHDSWSSPGELESWTDLTSSEERGRENEKARGTYNVIFQKGVWFHPAGIWKGEGESSRDPLYKLSTVWKNINEERLF